MKRARNLLTALGLTATLIVPAMAAGDDVFVQTTSDQAFADVSKGVENAIVNSGYKVDYHGFIGEMLKRTAADVGADKTLYKDAEFYNFCSAVLSRKVMEAEIGDIAYCPYTVFVYERADQEGTIHVGFRKLPAGGARDTINALLEEIVGSAIDGL